MGMSGGKNQERIRVRLLCDFPPRELPPHGQHIFVEKPDEIDGAQNYGLTAGREREAACRQIVVNSACNAVVAKSRPGKRADPTRALA